MTPTATTPAPLPDRLLLTLPGSVAAARAGCEKHCFAYHAPWRLFRHAGLKGNPRWHTGFYSAVLNGHQLPKDRPMRVLICAASDEVMLAVLARLLGPRTLAVTLVDACRTPLLLAAAYARQHSIDLTTVQARAPHLPGWEEPFDVIVTDGLLSLLPRPADAESLLSRLAALLHPDGLMLYTTRIAGPAGVLEYDRLGRVIQATATELFWPGPARERRALARRALTRTLASRPTRSPTPQTCRRRSAVTSAPYGCSPVRRRTPSP